MATAASDIRHTQLTREWSLGAVLARRLLGLRLAGFTTIVVDLGDAERITDVVLAALMRCRRKLAVRDGRMVVAAERPAVRRAVARAALEVADVLEDQ